MSLNRKFALTVYSTNTKLFLLLTSTIVFALGERITSGSEILKSVAYKALVLKDKSVVPELEAIRSLIDKGKISPEGMASLKAQGSAFLATWYTDELEKEMLQAISDVRVQVENLDPDVPNDREKLERIHRVTSEMRKAIGDIQKTLHEHAIALIAANSIFEPTSLNTFSQFIFIRLPKAQRSLNSLNSLVSRKLSRRVVPQGPEETFSDEKKLSHTETLRFAWREVKRFAEYTRNGNREHLREAKDLLILCRSVLANLPAPDNRTDFEVAIYGAYSALVNTLNNY